MHLLTFVVDEPMFSNTALEKFIEEDVELLHVLKRQEEMTDLVLAARISRFLNLDEDTEGVWRVRVERKGR